ncbi:MAG: hypothetical protein ACRDJN_29700, partial [Chloroflexota bacterium]
MVDGDGRRRSRRALLAAAGAMAAGAAGCGFPWQRGDLDAGRVVLPAATPIRYGREKLRLVLSRERLPSLDDALREAVTGAARQIEVRVEVQEVTSFLT